MSAYGAYLLGWRLDEAQREEERMKLDGQEGSSSDAVEGVRREWNLTIQPLLRRGRQSPPRTKLKSTTNSRRDSGWQTTN